MTTDPLSPSLVSIWRENPDDPGRLTIDDPRVRAIVEDIAPGATVLDLGGTMSLNALIDPVGMVLRVHRPFVSRARLAALQRLREQLVDTGLHCAPSVSWEGRMLFRCGDRWAELEPYIPNREPEPTVDGYRWLVAAIGRLHRVLAPLDTPVPRPLVATYAAPRTLSRWLEVASPRLPTTEVPAIASQVRKLRRAWIATAELPAHIVHGDARLGNIRPLNGDVPLFLDFSFAAVRPRVHELAYSLVYMVLAFGGHEAPERFDWMVVRSVLEIYEEARGDDLSDLERRALAGYMAAIPIYHAVTAGFLRDPAPAFRSALSALHLSGWLLDHPECVGPSRKSLWWSM